MKMGLGKLLLVDDDPVSHFIAARVMHKAQAATRLSFAHNGLEALQMLGKEPYDLVLLDINMPLMNGYEFLEALDGFRESTGTALPPVVLLTSSASPVDQQKAASYPALKGYITKPLAATHIDYLLSLSASGEESLS